MTDPFINLSSFPDLQNVGANTNVTFRIVNYGRTSSAATWYIYNTVGSTAPDFAVQGTVTQILPAAAPILSAVAFTNNQFSFTLTGTTGTNYIVQATTNLSSANWTSLITNPAPFTVTETKVNLFNQRFYRGLVAP